MIRWTSSFGSPAEGRSHGGICDAKVKEYDVPREMLEQDVLRLAGDLVGEALVEEREAGAAAG